MYKKLTCISNNLELGWELVALARPFSSDGGENRLQGNKRLCRSLWKGGNWSSCKIQEFASNICWIQFCIRAQVLHWLIDWVRDTKQTNFFWFGLLMGYGIVDDFAAMVDTLCMMRLPLTMLTWLTRQHLGTAISSNSLMSPPASVGKLIPLVTLLFKPTSLVLRLTTYSLSASSQLTNFVENFCIFGAIFGFLFVLKMLLQNHSALSKFCKMNLVPIWCLCCSWVLMPSSLQELTIKICKNAAKIGPWRWYGRAPNLLGHLHRYYKLSQN